MEQNSTRCRHERIVWYSDGQMSVVNGHSYARCIDCDATTTWVDEDDDETL